MGKSIFLLLFGVVRWFWLWLPFLLFDLAGGWELYIQPFLFRLTDRDMTIPGWLLTTAWVIALVFATVRAYHSMRVRLQGRIDTLEKKLYPDDLRRVLKARIAVLLQQGRPILDTWEAGGPKEDDKIEARTHNWLTRVDDFVSEHREIAAQEHFRKVFKPVGLLFPKHDVPDHYREPVARVRGYVRGLESTIDDLNVIASL